VHWDSQKKKCHTFFGLLHNFLTAVSWDSRKNKCHTFGLLHNFVAAVSWDSHNVTSHAHLVSEVQHLLHHGHLFF
jgi:hypothetical protein